MTSQKVGRSLRVNTMEAGGSGLSSGNPAAERRLAAALRKIDREKKKRETAIVWNQRSFFIKQVFDQDNELRFVKASRRPKYLENIPPPPPDGDTSWEKEEYVFSFKPKRTDSSTNHRDRYGRRHSKEHLEDVTSKAPEPNEVLAIAEVQVPEEVVDEEVKAREEAEEQARKAEEERLDKEKRDRAMGVFGTRREKLKMPILMGAKKSNSENENTKEEVKVEESKESGTEQRQDENEGVEKVNDVDDDSLSQSKSSGGGSGESNKPKTRFPVLKVRALGLFAMSFKKSDSAFPPLQSPRQSQLPGQSSESYPQDTQSSDGAGRLPPRSGTTVTSSVPPQTAPVTTAASAVAEDVVVEPFQRPGSISLPNSPLTQRKPLVRQKSANSIKLGPERAKIEQPRTNTLSSKRITTLAAGSVDAHRKSCHGSRRDVTSGQSSDTLRRSMSYDVTSPPRDKHRRSLSSEKGISLSSARSGASSSALQRVRRDASAKPVGATSNKSTVAASAKTATAAKTQETAGTPVPGGGAAAPTPVPDTCIQNIWAKVPEAGESSRNRGQENKDGAIPVDDLECENAPQDDEIDVHVIRRIIRTLPTNLMMKTTKREVEAGGEYALFRQRLMDRAKADMTRKAALDPRFTKLEKSLCNPGNN